MDWLIGRAAVTDWHRFGEALAGDEVVMKLNLLSIDEITRTDLFEVGLGKSGSPGYHQHLSITRVR